MSFFAVLFALLIEQIKPLPRDNWVHDTLADWVGWTGRNFDAGKPQHARVVWFVTVIVPELVTHRWWHRLLHNQAGPLLRSALAGRRDVVVTNVRYFLEG